MLSFAAAVTGHVDVAWPLDDPFQEGEYTIYRLALHPVVEGEQPVLIHGGLDQVPASIGATFCPAERQIACIRTINLGFQLLAAWLLVALVAMLGGLGSWGAVLACLPTIVMLTILGGAVGTPVAGQQAAPGIRDLPVLVALIPMVLAVRRVDAGRLAPWHSVWPFALLGAVTAIGPFWAYNRGALLIVVAGAFTVAASFLLRSIRPTLAAGLGGAAGLASIVMLAGVDIVSTLENILYWSQNGALWRVPPDRTALADTGLLYACAVLILAAAWQMAGRWVPPGRMLLIATLLGIGALYLAQSMERADAGHIRWTLWPGLLLLTIGVARLAEGEGWTRRALTIAGASVFVTALVSTALIEPGVAWAIRPGWTSNLRTIQQGWPDDRTVAGPSFSRVAALVRASGRCSFAADNAGLVHVLSGMPPCSRFAFGAYIAPDRQAEVIATLAATDPAVILWNAPEWWSHIDGRDFTARAPLLSDWIVRTYPVQTSVAGHILRSKAPLPME